MEKKFLLALPAVLLLAGCPKTEKLYEKNAYNKGFFQDYYTEFEGLDKLHLDVINAQNVSNPVEVNNFDEKMADKDDYYRHGVLSKLYDGQTDCRQKYQLARVQINKQGFGTRLAGPTSVKQLEFAIRGGSSCNPSLHEDFEYNLTIGLFTSTKEYRVELDCKNVPTDNNVTKLFKTTFSQIEGVIGYTVKFDCGEFATHSGVTENDELSLMLYEVVLK